jgi:dienelactone hydrolase
MTIAEEYHESLRARAREMRGTDAPPQTRKEARDRAKRIRAAMVRAERDAFNHFKEREKTPLDAQVLGALERDGYRIERLIFQTLPGVYATANTYVPTGKRGRLPAVLGVHGHWAGARRDPVVQSRCIGLAKLGFFVLCLDAWGAGERGTIPGQNEYHGGLLGASLWPVGTPLHGLQLYENVRALDYLQSRPEVDPERIGCTGASGGGNQTTQVSAFDERVKCAVPVCSVGTFASYLDTACCVDEVLLDALTFAEEGDLLGMVAPRALMVITATRDVYHFGPAAAKEALQRAEPVFQLFGAGDRLRHVLFDSGHDYSRPMREAMYGWMTRWLKEEGDGSPIPEPDFQTEDPDAIRCFEPASRPEKVMTTVRWVRLRSEEKARKAALPAARDAWSKERKRRLARLERVLKLTPDAPTHPSPGPDGPAALLLHPLGREAALAMPLAGRLRAAGIGVDSLDLPGCGALAIPEQGLGGGIPDHNLVEWSLWLGRPLLGEWVERVRQWLRAREGNRSGTPAAVVGWREAGLAALLASALHEGTAGAAAVETLLSFRGEGPPHQQRMVVFSPDLLDVGDVPELAALSAPRPVLVANPLRLDGAPAAPAEVTAAYHPVAQLYAGLDRRASLTAGSGVSDDRLSETVGAWLR